MRISLLLLLGILLAGTTPSWAKKQRAKNPKVEMTITMGGKALGKIQAELYQDKAPKTVDNFIKYVRSGHYNGTIFHRVIDNFMIQGGGFTPKYDKKTSRAPIQNEADNGLKNEIGTLAMARTGDPHSASAQFFINVKDNAFLNHRSKDMRGWGYCVFGKVTKGMDIVNKIKRVKTGPGGPFSKDAPTKIVMIKKAKVL
jgi:peptidyl-prolyl cis-trans isomerase B (cyclophilin B)